MSAVRRKRPSTSKARLVGVLLERPSVRRFLYLHPDKLGPLRGVAAKAVWGYRSALLDAGVETWDDMVGVLYDLGYRLHSQADRADAVRVHYAHTLKVLGEAIPRVCPRSIIDYGCGPGILTEYLTDLIGDPSVAVVGAEIRKETLSYNRLLRPDIEWCLIDRVLNSEIEHPRLIVLDGVINYMSRHELVRLLGVGDAFFFFYASEQDEGKPLFTEFHLFETLHEAGFREGSVRSINRGDGGPNHVLCMAYREAPLLDEG